MDHAARDAGNYYSERNLSPQKGRPAPPRSTMASLCSWRHAHGFANLMKAMVGSGLLTLPWATAQVGVVVSVVGLALIAFLTQYAIRLLVRCLVAVNGAELATEVSLEIIVDTEPPECEILIQNSTEPLTAGHLAFLNVSWSCVDPYPGEVVSTKWAIGEEPGSDDFKSWDDVDAVASYSYADPPFENGKPADDHRTFAEAKGFTGSDTIRSPGSAEPTPCAKGTFQEAPGQRTCQLCLQGTHASETGQNVCVKQSSIHGPQWKRISSSASGATS